MDLDGTLKWSRGRTVVVQEERHQRIFSIRIEKDCEDRSRVSKLYVKTLFTSQF